MHTGRSVEQPTYVMEGWIGHRRPICGSIPFVRASNYDLITLPLVLRDPVFAVRSGREPSRTTGRNAKAIVAKSR